MLNRVIEQMILYNQNDVKRINHSLKVLGYAQAIQLSEELDEKSKKIILYTAVLHDIGIKESERKYNSSAWNYQEIEGPPVAEKMLSELKVPDDIIKRICFIIGNHHSYDKINGIDFQILVEADFLVNIYENKLSSKSIESIKEDYFKTESGKKLIDTMFLNKK